MTTIATDGKTIAADSLQCKNDSRSPRHARKIHVGRNEKGMPAVFALTGAGCMCEPLIEWIGRGAAPSDYPDARNLDITSWDFMVIDEDGIRSYVSQNPYPNRHGYPFSLGTGREFALGAMMAGASPEQAVGIAIQIDIHSGGNVDVIDIAAVFAPAKADTPAVTPEPSISDAEVDARVAALLAVANGASRPTVPPMVHENIRAA